MKMSEIENDICDKVLITSKYIYSRHWSVICTVSAIPCGSAYIFMCYIAWCHAIDDSVTALSAPRENNSLKL
jgi:hypothetical protein